MAKLSVRFYPDNCQVAAEGNDSLMHAITAAGIPLRASCGGNGTCGRCKVIIKEGRVKLSGSGSLSPEDNKREECVLACQCFPQSDLVVEIPPTSRLTEHRVLLDEIINSDEEHLTEPYSAAVYGGGDKNGAADADYPAYRRITLKLPEPGLEDQEDDLGRLVRAIHHKTGIERFWPDPGVLYNLPRILRQSGWEINVSLAEAPALGYVEIAEIEPAQHINRYFGLAVDIGTTTVAVQLVDLGSGRVAGVKGAYNKQAVFGDDVITRIVYAGEHSDGLTKLKKAVIDTINNLTGTLAAEHGIGSNDIKAAVCAGNTTMIHLFLGLEPAYIRLEPYTPVANFAPAIKAAQVGLAISPQAWVQFMPGIAGYMGGDITAGVLVTGMASAEGVNLFVDIGTNGEMVLGGREWLLSCACSAGPAFEGTGIRYGMRAVRGAIEQVEIDRGGLEVKYATVGNAPPAGICGSGLIESISHMYQAGLIDRGGKFLKGTDLPRVRDVADGREFVLAWSQETGLAEDITISENEVKNIIRSKAAVFAGISTMLQKVGLPLEAIDRVYIAGGFGRHINIRDAVNIGLFPDLPLEKYTYVGNSALKGARMALLSKRARELAVDIAGKMTYLELSAGGTFMDEYVSALFIPHTDLGLFPSVQSDL